LHCAPLRLAAFVKAASTAFGYFSIPVLLVAVLKRHQGNESTS
jgi:hypothetical protein